MAARPVFVPSERGTALVREIQVAFEWNPGMAPSQKKKNIAALHAKAAAVGLTPLLEISSKSEFEIGQKLSAFALKFRIDGRETSVESAFQGSKVFDRGGPFQDLYFVDSREAKRDERLKDAGRLIGFRYDGEDFPLSPPTVFYDWLYINALFPREEWHTQLLNYAGFTDIEFNPERSVNCQARSCATLVSLAKRGMLDEAIESFWTFRRFLQSAPPNLSTNEISKDA